MMVTPSVKLVRPLGQGGMGSVWVAEHLTLRTQVVVKFISNELKSDADARDRFSREAAAAAQVKSPHVVQTFDHGIMPDGVPYIVMELLEGRDLGAHLREVGKLRVAFVVDIMTQLARALDRVHERGIIHRDIKPENIFLCDTGTIDVFVKLLDFGIAKGVEMDRLDGSTKTGCMMGSPFYMSPEQIVSSRGADRRSDLWSLGVVVFEALTGAKPFDAETIGGLALKIHSAPLPRLRELAPELPPSADEWFARACAREPGERFQSAQEMMSALTNAVGMGVTLRGDNAARVITPSPSLSSSSPAPSAPLLAVGAATDGGVVRSSFARSKTKGRILGIAAVVSLGVIVGYAASRTGDRRAESSALKSSVTGSEIAKTAAPIALEPPPVPLAAAPLPLASLSPPPEKATTAVRPASPAPRPRPKASGAPPLPAASASSRPPTTPTTGHDIF